MALPIAQLGYMPNLSTPSGGGNYQKRNAWQDLAMTILAGVAENGLKNTFAGDNTTTAQTEGLLQDPKAKDAGFLEKFLKGPTTSDAQLAQLRQQKTQSDIYNAGQTGENVRQTAQLTSNEAVAKAVRDLQEVMQHRQLTSEEARALAGNTNAADIAAGRNFTDLSGIDKQVAGALEREKLGNATSTTNTRIMADSPYNLGRSLSQVGALQSQGRMANMIDPSNPNAATGGLDPQVAAAIAELLKKYPQLLQGR